MNPSRLEPAIRRILVALDAATHSGAALDSVAELAARLQAELEGLFVEDINLLRSAELPFVRQVSLPTGSDTSFDSLEVERELRNMAFEAKQQLAHAADRMRVKWSFRVVRGHTASEVAAASEEVDLVVLESSSRPLTQHVRLEAPARTAFNRTRRSMLFWRPGTWLQRPVLVVFDGSDESIRALHVAARWAEASSVQLVVLLFGESPGKIEPLQDRARGLLQERRVLVVWHHLVGGGLADLCRLARRIQSGVMALAATNPALEQEGAGILLESLDCPLLLVR